MTRRLLLLGLPLALLLALPSCTHRLRQASAPSGVQYVVGPPYQAGGAWHYPRAQFDYDESGLAVPTAQAIGLTANGESLDPTAMAAAHPSLQLPCVAKVTNLDTGLQVLVRINDRGPPERGRLIALTPRVMQLLGAAGQATARVRVQVQEAESRWLAANLQTAAEAAPVQVAVVPTGSVQKEDLPPPPGAAPQRPARPLPTGPQPKAAAVTASAPVLLRLPEQVTRVPPRPGGLYVEAGTFGRAQYAEILRARLASLGAQVSTRYDAPRDRAYRVRIGPLANPAVADVVLERTARAGVADARIVAE